MEVTSGESARLFTQAEANDLVPSLQLSFAAIGTMRGAIEGMLGGLAGGDAEQVVAILRGEARAPAGEEELLERLQALILDLGQTVEGLASLGVVVRELEPGQVDLPALHDGRVVMLCWHFGEPHVGWFHELDEEFEARRPLPESPPMLQ